ncbi:MAG: T9SS type B sorting domain-containing protein [Bacteroidales bacterium]|nr:T9SS type B sorting domain-containing protein [Bacteroidales bacterium]
MKKIIFIFAVISLFGFVNLQAQTMLNNGQLIYIKEGTQIHVNGDVNNKTGNIYIKKNQELKADFTVNGNLQNNANIYAEGIINLYGNWINNANFYNEEGTVNLQSQNQTLEGSQETYFYNLNLNIAGVKTLANNQYVQGVLKLNDSEIKTLTNYLVIENKEPNAIVFSSGFVSSEQGGYLSRKMNQTASYIFPVGNNFDNPIVRNVSLKPSNIAENQFNIRFAEKNPNSEGYNIASKEEDIGYINENFFHVIERKSGDSNLELSIFYKQDDGDFDYLADWNVNMSEWQIIQNSYAQTVSAEKIMKIDAINDFTNTVYALAKYEKLIPPITIYNSFSPNGDGLNDYWIIDNCDNCEVKVYNRNGNLVFESDNNSVSWDGKYKNKRVPDATYYYVIDTKQNADVLKGSVTIIR